MSQKFCDHSVTRCHRNSTTTQSLDVTEILQSLSTMLLQKFYNHSTTGCHRNSAITQSQAVAEILRPLKHWMLQKFCDHSVTSCRRNLGLLNHWMLQKFCDHSVTSCSRNSATPHSQAVAEILQPLNHWMLQKICHSFKLSQKKKLSKKYVKNITNKKCLIFILHLPYPVMKALKALWMES